jgi:soluble lytic murein transglycosylase-like protein
VRARLFLIFLLFTPVGAQDHLQHVYARENERLDLLVRWSPGQAQPQLPLVVPFDPNKIVVPESSTEHDIKSRKEPAPDWNFTAWIADYNKGITLAEAELISRTIVRFSRLHDVDPKLVVALVAAESAFRRGARSPVGAQGLGQLMPGTAAMLGVTDPWDPGQNLNGTVRYLARQLQRWDQDASLALASYNAGPGAVQKYGGIPPYRETQEYVSYVLGLHRELKSLERRRTTVSRRKTTPNS